MLRGMSIAESGFLAAGKRLHAAASNLANANTVGRLPASKSSAPAPYQPVTVVQSADPSGGTTAEIVPASEPYVAAYDPSSPYANAKGLVAAPNVDPATEMTNFIAARQDFLANAAVLRATDEMLRRLYEITDSHS